MFGAVSQVPGLRVFPRLDPPLPTPGQYDVELVLQSDAPPEQMLETAAAVVGAGWQSGKFLYVDTDLKIDLPQARVVIDREQVADLGLDLAGVGQELGTLLGGAYVNRFNYFDRSYKVIPQIGDEDRATRRPAARPQDQDAGRPARAGLDVHAHRDEHRAAHAEPLPAAQRGAGLRRRQAGRHEGRGAARPRGGGRGRERRRASSSTTPASRGRSAARARRSPSRSGSRSCSSIWCSRRSSRASATR